MDVVSQNGEINKVKVLMDVYKNENEELKYEYRVLYDKYKREMDESEKKYIQLYNLYQEDIARYENSKAIKITNFIKQSLMYRLFRKVRNIFIKKG